MSTPDGRHKKTLQEVVTHYNLCLSQNPKGTDQSWPKSYVERFYSKVFAGCANQNITLMQIGKDQERSLIMWCQYFSNAQIYGWDGESTLAVRASMNNGKLGDIAKEPIESVFMTQVEADTILQRRFDVIIEKRSTTLEEQVRSIQKFAELLKPDQSVLVVENISNGGLGLLRLIAATPKQFTGHFYDFRGHRLVANNCIYAIRRYRKDEGVLMNRLLMLAIAVCYLIIEGLLNMIIKMALNHRR